MRRIIGFVLATVCLFTFGCKGSGGGGSDGSISDSVGLLVANYQILDLITGEVTSVAEIPDLRTNPAYYDQKIVFYKVEMNGTVGASSGAVGSSQDPSQRSAQIGPVYLAVFELTQAQWQRIAGTTPWLQLASSASGGDVTVAFDAPMVGAAYNDVVAALEAWSSAMPHGFRLPTNDEWELTCRAGSSSLFSWGSDYATATSAAHCLSWEVASGGRGCGRVGSRTANELGFYDMHGNAAELTLEGDLRGGSWNTPTLMTRASHIATVDADVAHAQVGCRLVFLP